MGIALGLLGGLFLGGSLYLTPARLAKTIDRELRARLVHVEECRVYVRGPRGVPVLRGRLDSVDIKLRGFNGDGVEMPNIEASSDPPKRVGHIDEIRVDARDFIYAGARVKQALIVLSGIKFDEEAAQKRQLRLVELEDGTAEVRVTESELRARALERLTGVVKPRFSFEGERIKVSGQHKVSVAPIPFSLSGRVTVKNGTEVHLTDTDLRVSVVPVPDLLERRLLRDLNPVYVFESASQLPFKVDIQSVKVQGRELVAKCEVRLTPPVLTGIP